MFNFASQTIGPAFWATLEKWVIPNLSSCPETSPKLGELFSTLTPSVSPRNPLGFHPNLAQFYLGISCLSSPLVSSIMISLGLAWTLIFSAESGGSFGAVAQLGRLVVLSSLRQRPVIQLVITKHHEVIIPNIHTVHITLFEWQCKPSRWSQFDIFGFVVSFITSCDVILGWFTLGFLIMRFQLYSPTSTPTLAYPPTPFANRLCYSVSDQGLRLRIV